VISVLLLRVFSGVKHLLLPSKCPFFSFYFCVFCAQNRQKLDRKTRKNLSKEEDKEEDKEEKPKRTLTFLGEIKGESRVV